MNQEETLALFFEEKKGAWNRWAEERLAEKKALQEAGEWVEGYDRNAWNEKTRDWHGSARADFSEHEFEENADFRHLTFPGYAGFGDATFEGHARFRDATFKGDAGFDGATFEEGAGFGQTLFLSLAVFDDAKFERAANFHAMRGQSAFSLARTTFEMLPDFIQARFDEAPRLDNLRIQPGGFGHRSTRVNRTANPSQALFQEISEGPSRPISRVDQAARWRALKRLAIQAHDHTREQQFFKGELLARRWVEDKPRHGPFWFGLFYQLFSDFGRSILRPLLFHAASIPAFAYFYFLNRAELTQPKGSLFGWAAQRLGSLVPAFQNDAGLPPCVVGLGDSVSAALILSVRKALLFLGGASIEKTNQLYACLYGIHGRAAGAGNDTLPAAYRPIIPNWVVLIELTQQFVSAVLIFLILLAIRNHFRIR